MTELTSSSQNFRFTTMSSSSAELETWTHMMICGCLRQYITRNKEFYLLWASRKHM